MQSLNAKYFCFKVYWKHLTYTVVLSCQYLEEERQPFSVHKQILLAAVPKYAFVLLTAQVALVTQTLSLMQAPMLKNQYNFTWRAQALDCF